MDDGVLFGTFVSNVHGSTDSAICAFRWQGVEEAFKSSFVKRPSNAEYELDHPVPANELPSTRPGGDCPRDPTVHEFYPVLFLQSHPLLIDPAKPRHDRPFYARRGLEFKSLAVFVLTESWGSWVVCYVGTAEGAVLKIAEEYQPNGPAPAPAVMVDTFNVTGEPIRKMLVSLKRRSLYVFADDAVRQYRLDACEGRHFECAPCVLDPFCGWDGKRCLPHTTGYPPTTTRKC
ncbi:semaphorin-2A-like [Haemaphysalis longicornis]